MTQQKIQLRKIQEIAITWMTVGIFVSLYDHLLLHSNISEGHKEEYSLWLTMLIDGTSGFVAGIVGGWLLTTLNQKFRSKPYYYSLIVGSISFLFISIVLILIFATLITGFIADFQFANGIWQETLLTHLHSTLHLKNIFFWAIVTILTQFFLQVSEKFGPGNLWNILSGKYHTPKREHRIFMFLDLKSSTTIAEKLGEEKYHRLLQEVFSDITNPILQSKAEIYQYVGDEIIISWNLRKQFNPTDCLEVVFAIAKKLASKENNYEKQFGILPAFKAGAHIGHAIVGEIGIIKRDITYSGDLLNTCARIQGSCNDLDSMFLISEELKSYLKIENKHWIFESKGTIQLKGKKKGVELFDVQTFRK